MTNEIFIYDFNATAIAAILEYIQLPNHPMHEEAKELADEFLEAHRKAKIEMCQRMMQEQIDNNSAEDWASIVD